MHLLNSSQHTPHPTHTPHTRTPHIHRNCLHDPGHVGNVQRNQVAALEFDGDVFAHGYVAPRNASDIPLKTV